MAKPVTLLTPAQVVDIRPRADGSWKLSFETQLLEGAEVAMLAGNLQGAGWLAFTPNEADMPEAPETPAEPGVKTRSERLRSAMYAAWKSNGAKGDFEAYRNVQMERLIELFKSKIVEG